MKTTYRTSTLSPYQIIGKHVYDIRDKKHPVNIEIQKSLKTHNLTATFEENAEELETLKDIPGVISIKCILKLNDQIIATGSGMAVISRVNRYVERTVRAAVNSSLISAIYQAVKVLDAIHFDTEHNLSANTAYNESYKAEPTSQGITDKQKSYLRELITTNVLDERERDRWNSEIDQMTRDEASQAIQSFKK